jgi:hypothetical protein
MRLAVTTLIVCLSLGRSPSAHANDGGTTAAGTLAQARRLIEAKDYPSATVLLEDLLPDADLKDRPAILELLRKSYQVMARAAQAAGRDREAAHYLDNLAIIARSHIPAAPAKSAAPRPRKPAATKPLDAATEARPATAVAQSGPSSRNFSVIGAAQDSPAAPPPAPSPLPEPAKMPVPEPVPQSPQELAVPKSAAANPTGEPRTPLKNDEPTLALAQPQDAPPSPAKTSAVTTPSFPNKADAPSGQSGDINPSTAGPSLEEGDRLYKAGRYDEAGRCYAALARQNRLPARRTANWAYCRMVEVVRRVNARPKSAREWDAIEAEIVSIQRLTPHIWYGEYLRNKVAEVRRNGRRSLARADNLVVRGSAPDENQSQQEASPRRFPRLLGKQRADSQSPERTGDAPAASNTELPLKLAGASEQSEAFTPPTGRERSAGSVPAQGSQALLDPGVKQAGAERAAASDIGWQVVETPNFRVYHRDVGLAEAAGQAAEAVRTAQAKRWGTSAVSRAWTPRCDLYLYPTGKIFARETNQPEDSPGFSTMRCNGNRVVGRRMNLRADHPQLLNAILPHEVTHVVLADVFTVLQIPRWADEGIAVLAEPRALQQVRAAELQEPLEAGRVFELSKLMAMDYPEAKHWSLYYAQSVSLTRFLVELGQPAQFVQFVRDSQRDGIESALRATYRIAGFAELQDRWMEYARQQFAPLKEARRDPDAQRAAPVDK